jgi:hypothetical protein
VSPRARHWAGAAALFCTLVATAPPAWVRAEELAFHAGSTGTEDGTSYSYAWQLEHRENVWRFLDAPFL